MPLKAQAQGNTAEDYHCPEQDTIPTPAEKLTGGIQENTIL